MMDSFSGAVRDLVRRAAAEQGGVISGDNPTHYNASNPIRLWVIQVVIIIGFTQLLSLGLSRIRQPRVIAEVIAGVVLGPTVMGRIPNFRATIFPDASLPLLTLTANIGLILFLFVVGIEVDLSIAKRNAKASALISAAGLIVPLGLGAVLAIPLYHEFVNPSVNYGYFILFTAVAIGITAFPVLCRILTELRLLDDTVGVVVLAAGVGNDVVGWILLALSVALVNSSGGLTALYVLLASSGYILFVLFPVKWAYRWIARRTGCLANGTPNTMLMTITLLVVFASAFFTDIIGIHAIFGGFIAGLIIPHDNGFGISLVEKFEDLVGILFLPVYFTLSGLRTNLGLLDNGVTWGYTILICVFAFVSKFFACGITAKFTGFNFRESGAIGALMSCKGLVELIVLNVGLQAKILDTRLFSMFVVHALVLTFITTPLTLLIYPTRFRTRAGTRTKPDNVEGGRHSTADEGFKTKFAVLLEKVQQLPAAMALTRLIELPISTSTASLEPSSSATTDEKAGPTNDLPDLPQNALSGSRISVDALRMIELSERTSGLLRSHDVNALLRTDPVISVFRTFGNLNRFAVTSSLSVVPREQFAGSIAGHVESSGAQMLIVPWIFDGEEQADGVAGSVAAAQNPFEGLIQKTQTQVAYSQSVRQIFAQTPTDVALFVDRGLLHGPAGAAGIHVFLPFFGGPDDRLALTFVVQLCLNEGVSATVVRFRKTDGADLTPMDTIEQEKAHQTAFPDTVYGQPTTQTRLQSQTADGLLWDRYAAPSGASSAEVTAALKRITFRTESSAQPLHRVAEAATIESARFARKALLVVSGRSRRMAAESHTAELAQIAAQRGGQLGTEVPKTFGDVAAALVATGTNASLLVVQAST